MVEHIDTVELPLRFSRVTGGLSNLTYLVEDGLGVRRVLRRPPHGGVLASAHDVAREWQILDALADSAVPVPRVLARCRDTSVTGSSFYVMSHEDGAVLHGADSAAALSKQAKRTASEAIIDILVAIHNVELRGPIAEHRRTTSFAERQLRRWSSQLATAGGSATLLTEISVALRGKIPVETKTTVVHGDYRPGNMLFDVNGTVQAVLDWELWTVGEPLADLAWLLATWESDVAVGWAPDPQDGFLDCEALASRYADLAECDRERLRFYRAFSMWKLAVITEGVVARYSAGTMGEQPGDLEEIVRRPLRLATRAREILAE